MEVRKKDYEVLLFNEDEQSWIYYTVQLLRQLAIFVGNDKYKVVDSTYWNEHYNFDTSALDSMANKLYSLIHNARIEVYKYEDEDE